MDWPYAAGFLDADGSIGFASSSYEHPRPVVSATQMTRPVLEEMQKLFGHGSIHTRPNGLHVYRTTGFKLYSTLKSLRYYLIVKQPNADRVIEFIERRQDAGPNSAPDARCLELVEQNRYIPTGNIFATADKQGV